MESNLGRNRAETTTNCAEFKRKKNKGKSKNISCFSTVAPGGLDTNENCVKQLICERQTRKLCLFLLHLDALVLPDDGAVMTAIRSDD